MPGDAFVLAECVYPQTRYAEGTSWGGGKLPRGLQLGGGFRVDLLQKCSPDEDGQLESLPGNMSVAELSDLILGRPDHGLFLACWACLWGWVPKVYQSERIDQLFNALNNDRVDVAIARLQSANGVAPHPQTLAESVLGGRQ